MPSMQDSQIAIPERYQPVENKPEPAQYSVQAHGGVKRSPVMLASLPGLGAGPDTVMRQFYGGRPVPSGRLFVPGG